MDVLRAGDYSMVGLAYLLGRYGLDLRIHPDGEAIPGSYWGDTEAGLIDCHLHARTDTPLHSILHESCHYICMSPDRRNAVHTNAGGDFDEENAVCYMQILLADHLPGFGRTRMMHDMNCWGYSFRLGSAEKWFEWDADDPLRWLHHHGLVDLNDNPTFITRCEPDISAAV